MAAITWTTTTFEAQPVPTDLAASTPIFIQQTRKAVGERLRVEHDMSESVGANQNDHGKHVMGSARAFYYTETDIAKLPAVPSTLPTYDINDGFAKGRIAFERWADPVITATYWYRLKVYKSDSLSSGWTEPSYAHTSPVDETLAGTKTFKEWPRVTDVSGIAALDPYKGHPDTTLVPVAALKQALTDYTDVLQNAIIPLGFMYTQYPGFAAPTTMWPWATWSYSEAAVAFDGAFFRSEGTDAGAFGSGTQPQQLLSHQHSITYGNPDANSITGGQDDGGTVDHDTWGDDHHLYPLPAQTELYPDAAATENRPRNVTVRIWKRTA